jgi:hypothetical protein
MHAAGTSWLGWIEGWPLAVAMRQWLWLYPIVEIVHILGFVFLVGAALLFDLRLLGLGRRLPVADLAGHLLRWSWVGLMIVVPSGLAMFAAHATEMAGNPAFRLKLLLILAAGANALIFHRGVYRRVDAWGCGGGTPAAAKLAGILSLALWAGVLSCGRLLAYF